MKKSARPKDSLKILNTREKKQINKAIKEQWGCELDKELVFLLSNKERLYICHKDIGMIDTDKLRIDNMGLYVCNVSDKGVRLTIDGSQILGPKAKRNVIEISEDLAKEWLRGKDLATDAGDCSGYVILKNKDDFLGCGKVTERGILNFVPKSRRILSAD
jgi:NOL1/NOP2/fmu family ribosome biogenesis protein